MTGVRYHLAALAQMYDVDFIGLAIVLVFALIVVLTVVIFVVGVSHEALQKLDARKRKINSRRGFPVEISSNNPSENRL